MVNTEWLKLLSPVRCKLNDNGEYVVSTNSIGNVLIHWVESGNVFKLHGGIAFHQAVKRDFHCKHIPGGWILFNKSMWPNVARWISLASQHDFKQMALSKAKNEIDKLALELKGVAETEIKSEGYRRIGQDKLRQLQLVSIGECEVSGIKNKNLLVVSHIKPWEDCVGGGTERLDTENVLLLAANWDALFDKKFISFDPETGKMIRAARIDDETLRKFGVPDNWPESVSIPVNTDRRREYLRWHNKLMEKEDAKCRVKHDAGD